MAAKYEPSAEPPPAVPEIIEVLISRLLLGGVIASMLTVAVGVAVMYVHHPDYLRHAADSARLTSPGIALPSTLASVASGLREGHGEAIVMLGILLLIATPIMRVAVSVIGFAIKRDLAYTVFSAVVLAALLISFLLGKAG